MNIDLIKDHVDDDVLRAVARRCGLSEEQLLPDDSLIALANGNPLKIKLIVLDLLEQFQMPLSFSIDEVASAFSTIQELTAFFQERF